MSTHKLTGVPLEEALAIAGAGVYTYSVIAVTGITLFGAFQGMQVMAFVVPSAGCDLGLDIVQKGLLTSMAFLGMIFSSHLFGFLADSCGRKRVMLFSSLVTTIISILSSLAPNAITLMVINFINGFVLGGIFTPAYVYVSEFCPQLIRGRALLITTSIASLATVYLPCVAWLVIPMKVEIVLFGGLVFTSWRLFLALLAIPNLLTFFLLHRLPETPKFLLNSGQEQETLEILKSMYALNMGKDREDYPVEGICLDDMDKDSKSKCTEGKNTILNNMKSMFSQTATLFTSSYLPNTIMSCVIFFAIVGSYNTIALWIPELTRQLMVNSDSLKYNNRTLCDIMSNCLDSFDANSCQIKHETFSIIISIGLLQSAFFCLVSVIAPRVKRKILIGLFGALSGGASLYLNFAKSIMQIVSSLGAIAVLLLGVFPICLSLVVDFYPTNLRSTATSIIMLSGRSGAAAGAQIVAAMFHSYCSATYWSLSAIIFGAVVICIFLPEKKK